MPLPKPTKNKDGKLQSQESFMERCLDDKNIKNDFKSQNQRVAVCLSIYKDAKKNSEKSSTVDRIDFIVLD